MKCRTALGLTLVAIVGLVTAVAAFGAYSPDNSVVDNFNRADSANLGANWSAVSGGNFTTSIGIASNQVAQTGTFTSDRRGGSTFQTSYSADQEAGFTVTHVATSTHQTVGILLRMAGATGIECAYSVGAYQISTVSSGTVTVQTSAIDTQPQVGDKLACFASGQYVEMDRYISSSGQWVVVAGTTGGVRNASGFAGISLSSNSSTDEYNVDDFFAGPSTNARAPQSGYVVPAHTVTVTNFATTTSYVFTGQATVTTAMGGGGSACGDLTTTPPQPPCAVSLNGDSQTALEDVRKVGGYTVGILAALLFSFAFWRTFGRGSTS